MPDNDTHPNRPRARNPQGGGARLRQELIAAAGRLLATSSDPESLSLRGVAREAGVAAPSVYLQFENKDALLLAVVIEHFAAFQRAIEDGVATGRDPASGLIAGCLAYCRFAAEHPGSYRIIFETPLPRWSDLGIVARPGMNAFQVLVNGVAACIDAGVARPGDPFRISTDIWVALHGMVSLRRHLPGFPWPAIEDQLAGILEEFTGIHYRDDSRHGGDNA